MHPSYYNGRGVPYNDQQHRGFEQTCPPSYFNPVRDPMESQEPPLRARTPPFSQGQPVVDSPFGSQAYASNRPSPAGVPSPSPLGAYSAHPRPVSLFTQSYISGNQYKPTRQTNTTPSSQPRFQPQRSNPYQYPSPHSRSPASQVTTVNPNVSALPSGYQFNQQPQNGWSPDQPLRSHKPPLSQTPQLGDISNQYPPLDNRSSHLSQSPRPVYLQPLNKHGLPYPQPTQPNQDPSPTLSQSPTRVVDQASGSPLREEQPFYDIPPLDEDVQRQLQQPYYQNPYQQVKGSPLETVLDQLQLEPTEKTPLIPPRHIPEAEPVNTFTPYGQNAHYSPPPVPSPLNYRPQSNVQQASMYEYHGNRRYSTEEESSTLPEGQPLDDYYQGLKLEGVTNGKQTFKEAIGSSANRETPTEQPQARRMGDTPSSTTDNKNGEAEESVELEFNSEILDEPILKPRRTSVLEKNLDYEIDQIVEDLFSESGKQDTNQKSPFDPNLTCPFCPKVHRIGEIQKFKLHYAECKTAHMKKREGTVPQYAKSMVRYHLYCRLNY